MVLRATATVSQIEHDSVKRNRYRPRMRGLRQLLIRHARAAWLLVAVTLAMKLVVPVGFMPSMIGGRVAIVLCTGMGPQDMKMAMPGMAGHDRGGHAPSKPESPCLGAGIAAPVLSGADPIHLALAFAVAVVAAPLLAIPPPPRRRAYLRPRPRGPPRLV